MFNLLSHREMIIAFSFLLLPVFALQGAETPASMKEATLVDAFKARELAIAGAIFVDPRTKFEYGEEHIKFIHNGRPIEAVYMRMKDRSENKVDFKFEENKIKLDRVEEATGGNKNKGLILYCNGTSCWKSFKVIKHLKKEGYTNTCTGLEGDYRPGRPKGLVPRNKLSKRAKA